MCVKFPCLLTCAVCCATSNLFHNKHKIDTSNGQCSAPQPLAVYMPSARITIAVPSRKRLFGLNDLSL